MELYNTYTRYYMGETVLLMLITPGQTQASRCLSLTPNPIAQSFSQASLQHLVDAVTSVISISAVARTLSNVLSVLNLGSRGKYFLAECPAKGSSYPVICHTLLLKYQKDQKLFAPCYS